MPGNHFNLIDEPWIPVADVGRVSLRQIFTHHEYRALGGNPVQKIALTKLLLAIAQAACTPENDQDWADLKVAGMAEKCLEYLDRWHERFYLYGDKPFLQMPAIKAAAIQPFGAVLPEVSTGNTTVLNQGQIERPMTDADKALLIVQLMGFGLGGKADNSVVLTNGYHGKLNSKGNVSVSLPGPCLGKMGYLHNFLHSGTLQQTLWFNLFTKKMISGVGIFPQGIGRAPWEEMPDGENGPIAQELKSSLIGRLVPVSHFCLLADSGIHYSEGVAHLDYKSGVFDPSVSINFHSNEPKAIWVDPIKRPWRQLTSLLSFISETGKKSFDCFQLKYCISRAIQHLDTFKIWSGGLRVSGGGTNKQYISGSDDFVESLIELDGAMLDGNWFTRLQFEMEELEKLAEGLGNSVYHCNKRELKESKARDKRADALKKSAQNLFWQLSERRFQDLVFACDDADQVLALRPTFAGFAFKAYDTYCPRETARQLDAWAKNRPNLSKYLKNSRKEKAA
jgi:CRISPR system Cascade subunit CasA